MNNLMEKILEHYNKNEYKKSTNEEDKIKVTLYNEDAEIHSVVLEEDGETVLLKEEYSETYLTFEDFGMFLYWFDQ